MSKRLNRLNVGRIFPKKRLCQNWEQKHWNWSADRAKCICLLSHFQITNKCVSRIKITTQRVNGVLGWRYWWLPQRKTLTSKEEENKECAALKGRILEKFIYFFISDEDYRMEYYRNTVYLLTMAYKIPYNRYWYRTRYLLICWLLDNTGPWDALRFDKSLTIKEKNSRYHLDSQIFLRDLWICLLNANYPLANYRSGCMGGMQNAYRAR